MKILFVCGSMEPGQDGVGDYTSRIAGEVIRQGHTAEVVALRDAFVDQPLVQAQTDDSAEITVTRIPWLLRSARRFSILAERIKSLEPDLMSLQYVPFSFHHKGLPAGLGKRLREISKDKPWQIMFHELWVGMPEKVSVKHKLWGKIQQRLIRNMIRDLKPAILNTQSTIYLRQLARLGFKAEQLPLFSNIPVADFALPGASETGCVKLVVFGSVHRNMRIADFIEEVLEYVANNGTNIDLTFVGRNGSESTRLIEAWRETGLPLSIVGEKCPRRISQILSSSTIGVATGAAAMIEKNSTVATMLHHNLPILCIGDGWAPRGIEPIPLPSGVFDLRKGCLEDIMAKNGCYSSPSISSITRKFIQMSCGVSERS